MPTRRRRPTWLAVIGLLFLVAGCDMVTGGGPSSTPLPSVTPVPPSASPAQSPFVGKIRLDPVVGGLELPLDIAATNDGSGRLFVVEQNGRIRTVQDGELVATPFLDISDRITTGGEQGLLGMALHPDFPADDRVFVDYTDLDGNTVVSSFTMSLDGDALDAGSERMILQIKQPFGNHNGGAVVFGPDGMLYVGMGDGGSGGDPLGNGQRLDTLLAKILRIDVDVPSGSDPPYEIPSDNPYADGADGALPEIWTSGMRNPWRIQFDSQTGDLWIGDVGQGAWEEIDVVRAAQGGGQDFGWNIMEGFHCFQPAEDCDEEGLTLPVTEYGHDLGCAVVGGVVVHDGRLPTIDGRYIFADNCSGNVWQIDARDDSRRKPTLILMSGRSISTIATDASGAVYMTDLIGGELLRVDETGG
jgi:glucose/arabinose dehydrogenase